MDLSRLKQATLQPKERCTRCKRPIAVLKGGTCIYCGQRVGGQDAPATPKAGGELPPEVLLALASKPGQTGGGGKWTRRLVAAGITMVALAFLVGSCMKM